ncbi:unnamed protein product [Microthlaspi erraticum]|uniref:F-box domain-containing protein n=1 Tax=Microthlaspi erraticum TaxID=1685480 RepID=A0A6D2KVR9_9BRAS|nr:unnamed protein product [Microthlaspi erraticum]
MGAVISFLAWVHKKKKTSQTLITSLPKDVSVDCTALVSPTLISSLPKNFSVNCIALVPIPKSPTLITSHTERDSTDCTALRVPKHKYPDLITLLPADVLTDCIARVPKHWYPTLSLVSKLFRSMVASPELYARRSLLGFAESCIYVPIHCSHDLSIRWYTLLRNQRRLVPIPLLPLTPYSSSVYVVLGSRIFVLGGYYESQYTTNVSTMDCRYDTVQPYGTMPKAVVNPVAEVVDGKIYVIGGHHGKDSSFWSSDLMMVLDVESQTWEYVEKKSGLEMGHNLISCVALEDKIYIKGCRKSFVFKPKEGKWEEEANELLHSSGRGTSGCVVDGILYSYDTYGNCLRAYDLKKRLSCGVVKGLGGLVKKSYKVFVVRCGENSVLLMQNGDLLKPGIWCAEIALTERNQRGEIWGKVEWSQLVLDGDASFSDCLSVMV